MSFIIFFLSSPLSYYISPKQGAPSCTGCQLIIPAFKFIKTIFQIKNSFKTEMESVFHIIVAQQPTCTERNAIERTQRTSRRTGQRNGPKQRNNPNGTEAIDGNNVGSDNTLHREPKRITQLPMEVTIHY
jgi:hypothetical protein